MRRVSLGTIFCCLGLVFLAQVLLLAVGGVEVAPAKESETAEAIGIHFENLVEPQPRVNRPPKEVGAGEASLKLALEAFQHSLDSSRRAGDHTMEGRALQALGRIYSTAGNLQKGRDYYLRALTASRQSRDPAAEAGLLTELADIVLVQGESRQARTFLLEALQIWRRIGDARGESEALLTLAALLISTGHNDKAIEVYGRALNLSSGDPGLEARAFRGMATAHADPKQALILLNKALDLERQISDRSAEAWTRLAIARVERRIGRLNAARQQIEAAIGLIESLRYRVYGPELRSSFLASRMAFYEFQINLLMELHRRDPGQGYSALALQTSERARARSLLEMLSEARVDVRQGVAPSLLREERRLAARLDAIKHRQAMNESLREVLDAYEIIQAQIRAASPHYARLDESQTLSLGEIQESLLDGETLLLEYSLGEERSFLWVVSQHSVASFELPPRGEIEREARRFHKLLSSSDNLVAAGAGAASANRLSRMLLGPVSNLLGGRRLVIVADGPLHYVPFAALPVPGSSGQPLITEHEIVMIPSASVLAALRRSSRPTAPHTVAVIADPVFSPDDSRLVPRPKPFAANPSYSGALGFTAASSRSSRIEAPKFPRLGYSRREADVIASLVPDDQRLTVTGFGANRDFATSQELSSYRIVHFATHGYIDSTHPELSGLVLSMIDPKGRPQRGLLDLQDVYGLSLSADLVVLSGCSSALGREVRGEGLVGLTRGFLSAGAKQVLATLWDANDRATAELIEHFYRAMLSEGHPPSSALRAAQLAMRRDSRWKAPYYWAGFVLQGDWQQAPPSRPSSERIGTW